MSEKTSSKAPQKGSHSAIQKFLDKLSAFFKKFNDDTPLNMPDDENDLLALLERLKLLLQAQSRQLPDDRMQDKSDCFSFLKEIDKFIQTLKDKIFSKDVNVSLATEKSLKPGEFSFDDKKGILKINDANRTKAEEILNSTAEKHGGKMKDGKWHIPNDQYKDFAKDLKSSLADAKLTMRASPPAPGSSAPTPKPTSRE